MSGDYSPSKSLLIKWHVRDGLKAAGTAAGQRVYVQRTLPAELGELPILLVFDPAEDVMDDALLGQPRVYGRDMTLLVVAVVSGQGDELETAMDRLVQAIEKEMQADESRGGLARSTRLEHRQTLPDEEGSTPIHMVVLTYVVNFYSPDIPGE